MRGNHLAYAPLWSGPEWSPNYNYSFILFQTNCTSYQTPKFVIMWLFAISHVSTLLCNVFAVPHVIVVCFVQVIDRPTLPGELTSPDVLESCAHRRKLAQAFTQHLSSTRPAHQHYMMPPQHHQYLRHHHNMHMHDGGGMMHRQQQQHVNMPSAAQQQQQHVNMPSAAQQQQQHVNMPSAAQQQQQHVNMPSAAQQQVNMPSAAQQQQQHVNMPSAAQQQHFYPVPTGQQGMMTPPTNGNSLTCASPKPTVTAPLTPQQIGTPHQMTTSPLLGTQQQSSNTHQIVVPQQVETPQHIATSQQCGTPQPTLTPQHGATPPASSVPSSPLQQQCCPPSPVSCKFSVLFIYYFIYLFALDLLLGISVITECKCLVWTCFAGCKMYRMTCVRQFCYS